MCLKIVSMGFVKGKTAYLRDGWNVLDFVVVFASLIANLPGMPNISGLRTARVLRPLRSLTIIPGMRAIVTSLIAAIPNLCNVLLLLLFVFGIFGILGMQMWQGLQYVRCRLTPYPVVLPSGGIHNVTDDYLAAVTLSPEKYRCLEAENNDDERWDQASSPWSHPQFCFWPVSPDESACSLEPDHGRQCLWNTTCGSNYDTFGNPRFTEGMSLAVYVPDRSFGLMTFDNMPSSFATVFQIVTLEGWVDILYETQDATSDLIPAVAFVGLVLFGAFFLLNLVLAVIWERFAETDTLKEREEEEKRKEEKLAEERRMRKRRSVQLELGRKDSHNPVIRVCCRLVGTTWFSSFIVLMILLNTVVLGMDRHPISQQEADVHEIVNFALSMVFTVEMVLKLIGFGVSLYLKDPFNVFDGVIVMTSLVELVVMPPSFISSESSGGSALSALRTFRLFRVFKLARSWRSLHVLLRTIARTLVSVANFSILLLLFMYIAALIGMQFFANTFCFDAATFEPVQGTTPGCLEYLDATQPRAHFDSLFWALITVFQILTGENWNAVMYDGWKATGWGASIYFVMVLIIGMLIVLNLFLAILLGNFEGIDDLKKEYEKEDALIMEEIDRMSVTSEISRSEVSPDSALRELEVDSAEGAKGERKKTTPDAPKDESEQKPSLSLRDRAVAVVERPSFDSTILILICVSSVALALDNPLHDPESDFVKGLGVLDLIMTILFTVEMALKIAAWGVFGKGGYIRNWWNVLDGVIVSVSWLSMMGSSGQLKSLRSLRTLRALRPLRMISRQPGLKLVVNALFKAIPAILNVLFVCVLFFMIFAIVCINYFKGLFFSCSGDGYDAWVQLGPVVDVVGCGKHTPCRYNLAFINQPPAFADIDPSLSGIFPNGTYDAFVGQPTSKLVCEWLAGSSLGLGVFEWTAVLPQNFDNIFNAMRSLFELSTTEGWADVMAAAVDTTGLDMQPIRDNGEGWALLFVAFMVVGSFFALNLFVGVVIDNFNRMKEEVGEGNLLLTEAQKEWVKTQRIMMKIKPAPKKRKPLSRFRGFCFEIMHKDSFEYFIIGCIIVNTVIMGLQFFGQPYWFTTFIELANLLFAFIFTMEALIKLTALDKFYFQDRWNQFDFAIVIGTNAGLMMTLFGTSSIGSVASVIRTFRVARMLRLVRSAKGLRQLFHTLLLTMPSLVNIGSLLMLTYFIFAIMGLQLFAKVKLQDFLDDYANFQTFWVSMLTLFRSSTGENWNFIMADLTNTVDCTNDPPYDVNVCGFEGADSLTCVPLDGCGSSVAIPYFLMFTLVISFVLLEMFTAVILEGFTACNEDSMPLTEYQYAHFVEEWGNYDPDRTLFIPVQAFVELMKVMDPPLGYGREQVSKRVVHDEVAEMRLNLFSGHLVHFKEVAIALSKRVVRIAAQSKGLEEDLDFDLAGQAADVDESWGKILPSTELEPVCTTREYFDATKLQHSDSMRSRHRDSLIQEMRRDPSILDVLRPNADAVVPIENTGSDCFQLLDMATRDEDEERGGAAALLLRDSKSASSHDDAEEVPLEEEEELEIVAATEVVEIEDDSEPEGQGIAPA